MTSKVDYRVFSISKGYPDHFHWLLIFYTPFDRSFFDKNEDFSKIDFAIKLM